MIVDLKPGLGEVSLFLGVRSRYTLLDALDNLHRLDGDFLQRAGGQAQVGPRHAGRLRSVRSARRRRTSPALEEVFRLLGTPVRLHRHRRRLADEPVRGVGALHRRHDRPGGQPRRAVRAQRAAAARAHRASSGRASERVRVLLNRAAEPYPIPPAQLQSALGQPIFHTFPSDYKTVSSALNSGVPLALSEQHRDGDAVRRVHASPSSTRRPRPPNQPSPADAGRRPAAGVDLVTRHGHCRCIPSDRTAGQPRRRAAREPARQAPRQQYLELRATVHRKLLNRLNLEALAHADRAARRERKSARCWASCSPRSRAPLNLGERETLFAEVLDDVFGLGPLEPLLRDPTISDILVNTHQHVFVEREGRLERVHGVVPGRRAPAARHRPHRQPRRPPRGRQLADGGCAPAGRLARQRHHSAAGGGRSAAVDSPVSGRAAEGRTTW